MSDNHEQSAEGPILEHQKRVEEVNAIIVRAVGFDGLKLLQGREDLRVQLRRRLDAHKEANGDEATFRKGIADFLTPHVPYLAIQKITENLKLIIPAFSDDQAVAMEELENIFKKKTGQAIAGNDLPPDYYSFLDKIALQIKYAPASQFVLAKLGLSAEQIEKVSAYADKLDQSRQPRAAAVHTSYYIDKEHQEEYGNQLANKTGGRDLQTLLRYFLDDSKFCLAETTDAQELEYREQAANGFLTGHFGSIALGDTLRAVLGTDQAQEAAKKISAKIALEIDAFNESKGIKRVNDFGGAPDTEVTGGGKRVDTQSRFQIPNNEKAAGF